MNSDFPCCWAVTRRFSGKGDPGRVPVSSTLSLSKTQIRG